MLKTLQFCHNYDKNYSIIKIVTPSDTCYKGTLQAAGNYNYTIALETK